MKPLLLAWALCQGLDTTTTVVGLHRGGVEQNPIVRVHPIAMKVSFNLAGIWLYRKSRREKPFVASALAVSGCAAGAWNLHQLR